MAFGVDVRFEMIVDIIRRGWKPPHKEEFREIAYVF